MRIRFIQCQSRNPPILCVPFLNWEGGLGVLWQGDIFPSFFQQFSDIAVLCPLSLTRGCSLPKLLFTLLPAELDKCYQCFPMSVWEGELLLLKYLCLGSNLPWSAAWP